MAEIARRIESKVALLVLDKDDEIQPKIREALEQYGKFVAYEALVGAKRPVTEIEKNPDTGKWTVTTLVDNSGAPILKPVSAYDIDRNFSKLVDMYMEDAVDMGMVEHRTVTEEPIYATREDLRHDGVLAEAAKYASGEADVAELSRLVKAQFSYETDLPDEEFQQKVRTAVDEILATRKEEPADTKKQFKLFVENHADGSYFDQRSDLARLANLVTRRTETLIDCKKAQMAKIPEASARCAQMMRHSRPTSDCRSGSTTTSALCASAISPTPSTVSTPNAPAAHLPRQPMSPQTKAKPQFSEPANSCPSRPSVQRHPAV